MVETIHMARWLIQLNAERIDLREFQRLFAKGDVHVIEDGGVHYLTGPVFEPCTDAAAVRDRALDLIDEMFPVVSVTWQLATKPEIGTVFRENDAGGRDVFVLPSIGNIRCRATVIGVSDASIGDGLTEAERMLIAIRDNEHLRAAARRWSAPVRSWSHLYGTYEELRHYLGQEPDAAGLCAKTTRIRFTQSAQSHDVAGIDARHGIGYAPAPANPMTLEEATEFIRNLMGRVFRM